MSHVYDFHETLPCAEDAGLPRDVYELQTAYARISSNDTLDPDIIDAEISSNDSMTHTREGLSGANKEERAHGLCAEIKRLQKKSEKISSQQDVFEKGDRTTSKNHQVYSTKSRSSQHDDLFPTSPLSGSENKYRSERKSQRLSKTTDTTVKDLRSTKSTRAGYAEQKSKHDLVQKANDLKSDRSERFESRKNVPESTSASLSVTSGTKTCHVNSDGTNEKDDSKILYHFTKQEKETGLCRELRSLNKNMHLFSQSAELDETSKTTVICQRSVKKALTKCDTEPMKLPSQNSDCKSQIIDYEHSSDVYFSVCFKCQKHEKNTPATSYCLKCAYYMCDRCLRHHDRVKSKRDHQVMKGNRMPGSFTVKKFEVERHKSEMCSQHSSKSVKNFCLDHNVLCCSLCRKSGHIACRLTSLDEVLIQTPDIRKLKIKTSESCKLKLNSLVQLHRTLQSKKKISRCRKRRYSRGG